MRYSPLSLESRILNVPPWKWVCISQSPFSFPMIVPPPRFASPMNWLSLVRGLPSPSSRDGRPSCFTGVQTSDAG
ncbi:MAG: hypothetical protein Q8P67_11505 [archaeon]|nr:hypothetical protein [archaeon]